MSKYDLVVVGGGAAGFFAAINAKYSNPALTVTILEKSNKVLSKVRVSGGGRCNVTHACFENSDLVKNYPRGEKELKGAFSRFTTSDTIKWFEDRGVQLKTEMDGRMFPTTDNSETIIKSLLGEVERLGIIIKMGTEVVSIDKSEDEFKLNIKEGGQIIANKLLIASGGNPISSAYDWLKNMGHTIETPVPSLFTFNIPNDIITELMGVSVPNVKARIAGTKLESAGPILITHWGLSGPAVLKLSAWGARVLNNMNYDFSVLINWIPKYNEEKLRIEFDALRKLHPAKQIIGTKPFDLPKRLWEYFVAKAEIKEDLRWADLPKKNTNILVNTLVNQELKVKGKTTFKEEFVTCGGISLKEIDFKTMQSTIVPNLYFAGEVIDVDGVTGGFNFQNAWTTAWIGAQEISINKRVD